MSLFFKVRDDFNWISCFGISCVVLISWDLSEFFLDDSDATFVSRPAPSRNLSVPRWDVYPMTSLDRKKLLAQYFYLQNSESVKITFITDGMLTKFMFLGWFCHWDLWLIDGWSGFPLPSNMYRCPCGVPILLSSLRCALLVLSGYVSAAGFLVSCFSLVHCYHWFACRLSMTPCAVAKYTK